MADDLAAEIGPDRTLLLVDDDEPFVKRLAKAMEKRGFIPETAESVAAGKAIAQTRPPAYAVVDLRLEDGNGLDVVETLRDDAVRHLRRAAALALLSMIHAVHGAETPARATSSTTASRALRATDRMYSG